MLNVKIPKCVSDYYSDKAVEAAVDVILQNKHAKKIDENYTWLEVRQFHQAYLSAQICRSSLIVMMLDIRDCLFLDNPDFEIGKTIEDSNPEIFTVEEIWKDKEVWTSGIHADSKLEFMASLKMEDGKLCLNIMLYDEEVIEHQKMSLGKDLPKKSTVDDDGDYWFCTDCNQLDPVEKWKDEIGITPIKKALDKFMNNLKGLP